MMHFRKLAGGVLVPVFVSGCAGMNPGEDGGDGNTGICVAISTLVGAAAGAALDGGVIGGVAGGGVGGILGGALCGLGAEKEPMMMEPPDADGDGVPDDEDACPGTPPDAAVDSKGCPTDEDGDGVPDFLDLCPDTPQGVRVNFNGCPYDSDGDGVFDGLDQCPGTPEGARVDGEGCEIVSITAHVNFRTDSSEIQEDSKARLDAVTTVLMTRPGVKVRIVGHTDRTGSDEYNLSLSLRRAQAVRDYLVGAGVAVTRLFVSGKGEAEPLVSNDTPSGRAVNRRVEFEVLQ